MNEHFEKQRERDLSQHLTAARNNQDAPTQLPPAAQTAYDKLRELHTKNIAAHAARAKAESAGDVDALIHARVSCETIGELLPKFEADFKKQHHEITKALDRREGAFKHLTSLVSEAGAARIKAAQQLEEARQLKIKAENLEAVARQSAPRIAKKFQEILTGYQLSESEARAELDRRGVDASIITTGA